MTDTVDNLFSGRRSFDRQLELLTVAVHTVQRDFGVLGERIEGIKRQLEELCQQTQELEAALHTLDKALVTRIATIRVSERVLWMVTAGLIALGVKFVA